VSSGKGVAQRIERLRATVAQLARGHVLAVVLEGLTEPPPGGTLVGEHAYARVIGSTSERRAAVLEALRAGAALPSRDDVVWRYRPGIAEFIRLGLMAREAAAFGARGDGKTGAVPGLMAWHADLHREAGHALPVPWLGLTDTFTSHEQKTIPSWSRAWLAGLVTFADGGHLATLTVNGVTLAAMRLVGVPNLGAASVARTETVGLWCEEAAPALVLDSATGVVVDVWALALTSRGSRACRASRIPRCRR
jgi:hypothetical protein